MKVGDIVIHPKMPELGVGIILEMRRGSQPGLIAYTRWDSAPAKGFMESFLQLAPAGTPIPKKFEQPFNERVNQKSTPFNVLVDRFLQQYPAGCDDPKFIQEERFYKEKASAHFNSVLGPQQRTALIEQKRFAEIVSLALEAFGPKHTNLLYPRFDGEYPRLKNGLQDAKMHEHFAHALCSLLDDTADKQKAFDAYADFLGEIGADAWANATMPLFFADYEKYIFVKSTIFQHAADSCDYRIDSSKPITWQKYNNILSFASYLKTKLDRTDKIRVNDMIDLQGFIYVAVTR